MCFLLLDLGGDWLHVVTNQMGFEIGVCIRGVGVGIHDSAFCLRQTLLDGGYFQCWRQSPGESIGDVPENGGGVIFVFVGLKQSDLCLHWYTITIEHTLAQPNINPDYFYRGGIFSFLIWMKERMWDPVGMLPNTRWVVTYLMNKYIQ